MSEKPAVSIIVPIYNVEKFIEECLVSLTKQTLTDIEIILVNDGTLDNSMEIGEKYAKRDSRIKIINQANSGLAAARNTGIAAATGEYIGMVDSDDYVSCDFFEKLYTAAKKFDADIAASSIIRKREHHQKYRVHYETENVFSQINDKVNACNLPKCCYVWNKIYRRELFNDLKFKVGYLFEDVFFTIQMLEKSDKLVTVPDCNYFYRVNSKSIVKSKETFKRQQDSYLAKKFYLNFADAHQIAVPEKNRMINKKKFYCGKFCYLKLKEYRNYEYFYAFGFIPCYKRKTAVPKVGKNTILVWEPCSKNHAEVVPGFAQYLTDSGYDVSVLVSEAANNAGLFSRFDNPKIFCNQLTKKQAYNYLKMNGLNDVAGILITSNAVENANELNLNRYLADGKKILKVEHSALTVENQPEAAKIIGLREYYYHNVPCTVVNPHFFGQKVNITPKNEKITKFITVGALRNYRKNTSLLIDAVQKLHDDGIRNFKIIVVGKGSLKGVPPEIKPYFELKGRLDFGRMYDEMEQADYFLPLLDVNNPHHENYITINTSGSFQLIYGFGKVAVIAEKFAAVNGFTPENSLIYRNNEDLSTAMAQGIRLDAQNYKSLQDNLLQYAAALYQKSLENLRRLINE